MCRVIRVLVVLNFWIMMFGVGVCKMLGMVLMCLESLLMVFCGLIL